MTWLGSERWGLPICHGLVQKGGGPPHGMVWFRKVGGPPHGMAWFRKGVGVGGGSGMTWLGSEGGGGDTGDGLV